MKKSFFSFIALLTFVILVVSFNPNATNAAENTKGEDFELPRYYDSNNKEIFPYTKEEYIEKAKHAESYEKTQVSQSIGILSVQQPRYYDTFGAASFQNFVWVNGGEVYRNPIYINMERITRTTGMAVYFYNSSNAFQGKVVFPKYGNLWEAAPADHLTRNIFYKFKLVSESGELAKVKHGNIAYDG